MAYKEAQPFDVVASSLSEKLRNGGNTPRNRVRVIAMIQETYQPTDNSGIVQDAESLRNLVESLEIGWRRKGEVPEEQLDSRKLATLSPSRK